MNSLNAIRPRDAVCRYPKESASVPLLGKTEVVKKEENLEVLIGICTEICMLVTERSSQ
jgi:hypothetical protein